MTGFAADALRTLRDDGDITASFFVPGRIEVLGKHTDYAGGRSLLAAVNRGFTIAAAARPDERLRILNADTGELLELDEAGVPVGAGPAWGTYPLAVARRCARNFPSARGGADMAFTSDLPQASGLSSSSALVVATFLGLDAVRRFDRTSGYASSIHDTASLAGYLGAVENGMGYGALVGEAGVGTMGGSEDHTAILCARSGSLVQYRYAPVRFEGAVAMPAGWTFAIASSGVRAEKAGAQLENYNRLAAAPRRLVQLWREGTAGEAPGTLGDIVDAEPDAVFRLREIVRQRAPQEADWLLGRLAQFVAESGELVPAASAALDRGDIAGFGDMVRRSQHYAEEVLRNQIPETMYLVDTAHELGAAAVSAFGAGFGGSVWALVRQRDADGFAAGWRAAYHERFPAQRDTATFFITPASGPATRLTGEAA